MNKILLVLLGFMPLLAAQNSTSSRPADVETRLVRLQHADAHKVRNMLAGTGAQVSWDDALRVLVISGKPSDVSSLEQTAKQIDADSAKAQSSNVLMSVYVIGATTNPSPTSQIPQDLQPVINQLKSLFSYSSYQILETALARSRVTEDTQLGGSLRPFGEQAEIPAPNPTYDLRFHLSGISGSDGSATIHINDLDFRTKITLVRKSGGNNFQFDKVSVSIQTNLDIGSGQKVVVGKAGAGGSNAIFLIVEARVAN